MVVTEYALERQGEQEVLHLFCHHEHEVAICPRCGQVSDAVHEQEERAIRHLDIWGKATYVHFPSRRFDCEHCKKPFTESLSWVESKRRESTGYELHVYNQCKHTDQAAVAEHLTQAVQAAQAAQVDLEQAVAAAARHQTDLRLEQAERVAQDTQS